MGSKNEAINCIAILTETDIEALLSGINMIRIEIKNEFTNFNASKKDSKKLIKILNEIIKKVEDDKK